MAAPKRMWTPAIVRERIQVTKLQQRLENHALGLVDMSATQIKAAEILLKKTVPDLSSVEHSGEIRQKVALELTDEQLIDIAARSRPGIADKARLTQEPAPVH